MNRYHFRNLEDKDFTVLYVPRTRAVRLFVNVLFLGKNHKCTFHHNDTLTTFTNRYKLLNTRAYQYAFDISPDYETGTGNYKFLCSTTFYSKLEKIKITTTMNKTVQIHRTQG